MHGPKKLPAMSSQGIGQINGLLRVDFLTDTADWTGEVREVPVYCPEKLLAVMIAQFLSVHFWTSRRNTPCHEVL